MTREELKMMALVRESDVIDRTDGSELAKAFNYLWEKYVEQKPCEDAISRQAVLDIVDSYSESQSNVKDVTQDIISDIVALPPVTPQPKTGHWINIDGGVECDKCGKWYPHALIAKNEIKFCSECGAKMVEQETKINEDISKGFEEFTRMMFRQGQEESEE